ncbi:hypothetical protein Pelo_15081 [Pelomyxa schiedti]|nr:hypothetical protein Pelo_15081 [Pelomyxa schiedti]
MIVFERGEHSHNLPQVTNWGHGTCAAILLTRVNNRNCDIFLFLTFRVLLRPSIKLTEVHHACMFLGCAYGRTLAITMQFYVRGTQKLFEREETRKEGG